MTSLVDKLINSVIPNAQEATKTKISNFVADFIQNPDQSFRNHLINFFLKDFSEKQGTSNGDSLENIFSEKFNINPEQLKKMKDMGLDIASIFSDKINQGIPLNKAVDKSPFTYLSIYAAIVLAVLKYGLGDRLKRTFESGESAQGVQLLIENLGDIQKESSKSESVDYSKYFAELLRLLVDGKGTGKTPSIIELLSNKDFQEYLLSKSDNGLPNIVNLTLPSMNDLYASFMQFKQKKEQEAKTEAPIDNMGVTDITASGIDCKIIKTFGDLLKAQEKFKFDAEVLDQIEKNSQEKGGLVVFLATIAEKDVLIMLSKQSEQSAGKKWLTYEVCTASNEEEPKAHYVASRLCLSLNKA